MNDVQLATAKKIGIRPISSLEELKERAGFRELLEEKTFERLVFLSRKRECRGKVEVVYDSGFNRLYSGRTF